jgi:hypothetical protein
MSSGSKKKEPRCTYLIDAKASHRQRMWAEVSSSVVKCYSEVQIIRDSAYYQDRKKAVLPDTLKMTSNPLRCISIGRQNGFTC